MYVWDTDVYMHELHSAAKVNKEVMNLKEV